ncbi:MAG: phenylacetate--CoA ligase family protein [Pseudomonadota bacterium]
MLIDSPLREAHIAEFRRRLPEHVARLSWSKERVAEEQQRGLAATLAFAKAKSPWHRERLRDIDPATFAMRDLGTLPAMTKADVMDHWDAIVTDPRLTLAKGNAHIVAKPHHEAESLYYLDEYEIFATGGSSGKRGVFIWDWPEFIEIACVSCRYQARDESNESLTGRRCLAVIEAGETVHGSLFLFTVSPDPDAEVISLPAATQKDALVAALNQAQPTHINAFASAINLLAGEALAGRLTIRPRHISTNSEPLLPETRDQAREVWGVEINNVWGCVEVGLIGVECDAHKGLHLTDDLIITEFVDGDGAPVSDPEAVEKVLVTSLYNRAMPLIRYEVTDLAIPTSEPCTCGSPFPLLKDVRGRADDGFRYGEAIIHPLVFRTPLGQHPMVEEYQVHQTADGADIAIVTRGAVDLDRLTADLVADVSAAGLANPRITLSTVDALKRHAETGKLKRFIPLKA